MDQDRLFYETVDDVLDGVVRACGGYKQVALELWPALKLETSYARIKACLNPEKPEKFSPSEVLWLLGQARARGHHQAMEWICEELGYSRPVPVEPSDQEAELARQADHRIEELTDLVKRLERLCAATPLKAIR